MPITEEEKQYIIEEETLRFETQKKLMQEEFGRWRGMRMGMHGYGTCGRHFWGFGLMKVVLLGLAIFGLCHLFHGSACGWGACHYQAPTSQTAPAQAPPTAKS